MNETLFVEYANELTIKMDIRPVDLFRFLNLLNSHKSFIKACNFLNKSQNDSEKLDAKKLSVLDHDDQLKMRDMAMYIE